MQISNLYYFPMLGSSVVMHVSPVGTSQAYVPVFMSVFLSGCQRLFLAIICVACNCAQRMWQQIAGSNPLSGSIIYPSAHPSGFPVVWSFTGLLRFFLFVLNSFNTRDDYYYYYYYQCGGPAPQCIYP